MFYYFFNRDTSALAHTNRESSVENPVTGSGYLGLEVTIFQKGGAGQEEEKFLRWHLLAGGSSSSKVSSSGF